MNNHNISFLSYFESIIIILINFVIMNKEVSFVDKLGKPNLKKDDEEDFKFFIDVLE